jgi:uncharacterized protein (DUF983 family)
MAQTDGKILIARAIRQKCPVCGGGAQFESHFRMNRACSSCGSVFWKDPGEGLGAMYLDYAVAFGVFLVGWLPLSFTMNLSDMAQFLILSVISVAAILICYPVTRSFWTVLVYISGGIDQPPARPVGLPTRRPRLPHQM